MATSKPFSLAAFIEFGNKSYNNASGKTPDMQQAFKTDLKRAIAHAGYPQKDELGIIDEINDFDLSNTLEQVPKLVSNFMAETGRKVDLPAPNGNTCPATLYVEHVDEKTKTGVSKLGGVEKPWEVTYGAHDEVKVDNKTKGFRK